MPCNCQKNSSDPKAKKTFTVESPSGKKTSFSKRPDAELYAARVGGKII